MKRFIPQVTLALSLLLPVLAHAGANKLTRMDLIRITSGFYSSQAYTLGIETLGNNGISSVFYEDTYQKDSALRFRRFPVASLQSPQVLIRAQGYEVVKIGMKDKVLSVYYRRDVRENKWVQKRFSLECDSRYENCSVMDLGKNRYITQAYITEHRVRILGLIEKAVGIEDLITR